MDRSPWFSRLAETKPAAIAAMVAAFGLVCGWISIRSHAELRAEPDLAASAIYFDHLLAGDDPIGSLYYFSAPKLLAALVFGGSMDTFYFAIVSAVIASVVLASIAFLVALSFGPACGLVTGIVLSLDPRWTVLASIGASDLLAAALVAAAAALWAGGRRNWTALVFVLATMAKPTTAAAAAVLLFEARSSPRTAALLIIGVLSGVLATAASYHLLLGDITAPSRFLVAYNRVAGPAPDVLPWLASYATGALSRDLLSACWPLSIIGLAAVVMARRAAPLRRLLAMSLAVAAAHVALAMWTETRVYARFLWLLELGSVSLAVVGAFQLAKWIAGRFPAARVAATTALVALIALSLLSAWDERDRTYVSFFEGGVRLASPLIDLLGGHLAPNETVNVALWLQPSVMRRLDLSSTPSRVEAAEVVVARDGPQAETDATWILLTPGLYESPGVSWIRSLAASGEYREIARTEGSPFALLKRASSDRIASNEPAGR